MSDCGGDCGDCGGGDAGGDCGGDNDCGTTDHCAGGTTDHCGGGITDHSGDGHYTSHHDWSGTDTYGGTYGYDDNLSSTHHGNTRSRGGKTEDTKWVYVIIFIIFGTIAVGVYMCSKST